MNNDLNLPIIKDMKMSSRILNMDQYLEFVMFNVKEMLDRVNYRKMKKTLSVNVPFVIK